ncbi:MAG: hypothetical protein M1818_007985 [Claussenomyces sp. TS43310]|nr:MAG: hypothetical protein M1818_007985 [Claussenomyces sp. TS43310]
MSSKQTLVVFGATGTQGGSVIKTILAHPIASQRFSIRAVTWDVSKPASKALAEQGIDVVAADLNDRDSLRAAIQGADAVFLDLEIEQGKNAVDIVKELGIKHLVFSSLTDCNKVSHGKYTHVLHFDGKAVIEEYIRSLSIPCTIVLLGIYMSFITSWFVPTPSVTASASSASSYTVTLPVDPAGTKIPFIDAPSDMGNFVLPALISPSKYIGQTICAAEKFYTLDQLASEFAEVRGLSQDQVAVTQIDESSFKALLKERGMPEFLREDLYENMRCFEEFGYFNGVEGLEQNQPILGEGVRLTTWKDFVAKTEF